MKKYPSNWIAGVMRALKARYRAKAYSHKETPWRSLVFTVLSARSRDEQTEIAYRTLLTAYRSPQVLAEAAPREIEPYIKRIGLYRNKARNLVRLAQALVTQYRGRVPNDLNKLVALPGVGRKTANCVMIYAFRKPAMCVDTHVHRVTNRLGWVNTKTPEQTEFALRNVVPRRHWLDVNRVMVQFGRTICVGPRPKCWMCPVRGWCRYPNKTPKPQKSISNFRQRRTSLWLARE